MIKRRTCISVFLLMTLASISVAAESSPEAKEIRLGYLPGPGHVLTFVAEEEGFFADQGLDVQLFEFLNSADGYSALTAGKLDVIAMGSTAPAVYISKGTSLRYIGGLMGEGAAAISLPERSEEFSDIANFRDKTIATIRMSTGDVVFRSALHDAGIDWMKDVTIQEMKSPMIVLDAVLSGKVDVGIVWLPYQQVAETRGLKIVQYGDTFYPEHPCCRVVVTSDLLEKDRYSLVKFEKALLEAYDFVITDSDKSVEDVQKYVDFDRAIIFDSIFSDHFIVSPDPNKKAIEQWWMMMNSIGYIKSDKDIDDYIDASVYKQALDELISENPDNRNYKNLLKFFNENDQ